MNSAARRQSQRLPQQSKATLVTTEVDRRCRWRCRGGFPANGVRKSSHAFLLIANNRQATTVNRLRRWTGHEF